MPIPSQARKARSTSGSSRSGRSFPATAATARAIRTEGQRRSYLSESDNLLQAQPGSLVTENASAFDMSVDVQTFWDYLKTKGCDPGELAAKRRDSHREHLSTKERRGDLDRRLEVGRQGESPEDVRAPAGPGGTGRSHPALGGWATEKEDLRSSR